MSDDDLRGRTILVTGTSTGIGLEIARLLARRGATLLMASRDPGRGRASLEEVRRASGSGGVEGWTVDLSSLADTRRFASEILAKHPRLDVVVHNAAVAPAARALTAEGIEPAIATNALAPFLLTHLLRPALDAAPAPRVLFVNGAMTDLDLDDLQFTRGKYHPFTSYRRSKTALQWLVNELQTRWKGSNVTVVAANPGIVPTTPSFRAVPTTMRLLLKVVARKMIRTESQAAEGLVWAATHEGLTTEPARIYMEGKPVTDTGWFPKAGTIPCSRRGCGASPKGSRASRRARERASGRDGDVRRARLVDLLAHGPLAGRRLRADLDGVLLVFGRPQRRQIERVDEVPAR